MISNEAKNYYYLAVRNLSELNCSGWLRGKKETIIIGDNNFENALNDALNYQNNEAQPERISKLNPSINKYNSEGIDFPARPKYWIKFERNNKTIALNVLYVQYKTKAISFAYRSEYNNKRKKQIILLMISNGEKQNFLLQLACLHCLQKKIKS